MSLLTTSKDSAPAAPSTAAPGAPQLLPPELQQAMSRVTEISSLPEITTRAVQLVEDPKSTAQDMHDIVKNDPALAAKILKVVNSAFYGLPAQIANLDRAIVMLGLSAVKNIALAASLSRLFRPGALSDRFSARDLWKHCISVGVCARMMAAASTAACQAEEAFVAGLVHDMGLLVEFQLFPEKLRLVIDECTNSPQDFCAAEKRVIGADHQAFGHALATRWKFPPALRNAIAYHHNPERLQPETRRVVTLIQAADTICAQNQLGFWLTAQTQDVTEEMLALLNLSSARVGELLEILPERIAEAEAIFAE
jgi:putative nucleotidyltransferase with HDIG domain